MNQEGPCVNLEPLELQENVLKSEPLILDSDFKYNTTDVLQPNASSSPKLMNFELQNDTNRNVSGATSDNKEVSEEITLTTQYDNSEQIIVETTKHCVGLENYFNNTIIELSRYAAADDGTQNYFRGCKWSPDGTCLLSVVNNQGMQVTELPRDLYSNDCLSSERPVDILTPVINIKEGGCVYDYNWYPKMSSFDPATCCWISSMQHGPVQLWDAFNGRLRCTYRGYNEVDEVEAALSVCFNFDGSSIYAGYKKSIKLFNSDRPGRDCTNFRIKYPASCMSLNSTGNILAIGSWRRTITLMSVESGDLCELNIMSGHKGGVTHLSFMSNGNHLISGARKDPFLQCWDLRYCNKPIKTFCRIADSNQRIYFDVSPCGTWVGTANTNGVIRVWDMRTFNEDYVKESNFPVHNDCCNGFAFHPNRPIIATSSGQFHFSDPDTDCIEPKENSLALWWIGDTIITDNIMS